MSESMRETLSREWLERQEQKRLARELAEISINEAFRQAEEMLFPDYPKFGEPGWRTWTEAERRKLNLMANSIYTEAGGKSFLVLHDGKARVAP